MDQKGLYQGSVTDPRGGKTGKTTAKGDPHTQSIYPIRSKLNLCFLGWDSDTCRSAQRPRLPERLRRPWSLSLTHLDNTGGLSSVFKNL